MARCVGNWAIPSVSEERRGAPNNSMRRELMVLLRQWPMHAVRGPGRKDGTGVVVDEAPRESLKLRRLQCVDLTPPRRYSRREKRYLARRPVFRLHTHDGGYL